jgi:hypothetical protein
MKTGILLIGASLLGLAASVALAQEPGTIVFSNRMIDPAAPGGLTDHFEAGDAIYAVAYLDKVLPAYTNRKTASKVDAEVYLYELKPPLYDYQEPSEVQLEFASVQVSGGALQQKFLCADIVPDPAAMTAYVNPDLAYKKFGDSYAGPVKFAEKLGQLDPGEHTIVVKVKCNYDVVAEGRFVLAGEDFSSYENASASINAAASGIQTQATVMPGAKMSDPALEKEMVAAFEASQTYKDRVKGKVERLVIIDPEWMIRRHQVTGAILHRYIRAAIAVGNADGSCTLWNLVTFQQDYVGDAFQKTRFDGEGDPAPIPVENVSP